MIDVWAGMVAMGSLVAGLYFLKFWRETGDRLFAFFAPAFWLLAVNYYLLGVTSRTTEGRPLIFVIRMAAFILILAAIIEKNREAD